MIFKEKNGYFAIYSAFFIPNVGGLRRRIAEGKGWGAEIAGEI
jgi:hypothetical protein